MDEPLPETLTVNTRSLTAALRDLATLLERGRAEYVLDALRSLADRVEQMAREEAALADLAYHEAEERKEQDD